MEPISPWSCNPGPNDLDDGDDIDVVAVRSRRRHAPFATLPADSIRHGARLLRWCALLLALISIVGSALTTYGLDDDSFSPYGDGWAQFGQFLSGISWSIGFAGIVLAASYGLSAIAARIDLDSVLAERETSVKARSARPSTASDVSDGRGTRGVARRCRGLADSGSPWRPRRQSGSSRWSGDRGS